jgi:hypothetical protein
MSDTWGTARRSDGSRRGASDRRDPVRALKDTGAKAARVLLIGLDEVHDDCWTVLVDAGVRLERADDVAGALRALTARPIPVVVAATPCAESLVPAVRREA